MFRFKFDKIPVTTLYGADWKTFCEVVRGREIDPSYRRKYLLTKSLSWLTSPMAAVQQRRYKRLLADKPIEKDPLFVLGHWRSGTTYMHNVLCCDKEYGYTTTYQTVFPNMVLFGQPFFKAVMGWVMPNRRPMDNLELTPDLPQEEEFALSAMTPCSYYNFWFFPRNMVEYCERFLLMNEATDKELSIFKEAFVRLVKLSLHNTGGRRYLSKNPPHTGRIKELLELFPNAKFIYLMRNPYEVYESTKGFFTQAIVPLKLHERTDEELTADMVEVYTRLYDKYQTDKALIPEGNLVEVKFEDFAADPLAVTEHIYRSLSLEGFEEARPAMEQYVGAKRGHKRNKYSFSPKTVEVVDAHWGRALRDWGYRYEPTAE